jgi:hypothetical protein
MLFTCLDLDLDLDEDTSAQGAWDLGPELAEEESRLAALDATPSARSAHYATRCTSHTGRRTTQKK